MKILCVSDIHDDKKVLKKIDEAIEKHGIDVMINAGDFLDKKDAKKYFGKLKIKTFFVHGNWDNNIQTDNKNVSIMKNEIEEFMGYYFVGLDSRFIIIEEVFKYTKDIPSEKMILITHEPPFGILDTTWIGNNAGFLEFRELAETKKPILHVFGHIHESAGYANHEGTLFVNAAINDSGIMYIVDLPSRKITEIKI